jgi:hypothetical protein
LQAIDGAHTNRELFKILGVSDMKFTSFEVPEADGVRQKDRITASIGLKVTESGRTGQAYPVWWALAS